MPVSILGCYKSNRKADKKNSCCGYKKKRRR